MKKTAGVIVIKDNQLLLVRAGQKSRQINGTYSFPGGKVEKNETNEDAAKRELAEETGLIAQRLVKFPENRVDGPIILKSGPLMCSYTVFIVMDFLGTLREKDDENEPLWIDLDQARKMTLLGDSSLLLENGIKFLKL